MLRMLVFGHQSRHRFRRRRADAGTPVNQPLRRPFHVRTVRRRHVRGHRRKAAEAAATGVAGYPLAPVQQLDHGHRHARLQHLADQRVRHAVAVPFDLDVVVDVSLHGFEVRHLVALQRQRLQGRRVDGGEGAAPGAGQLLERLVVEPRQQRRDGRVDLVHAGELLVPQARHDPPLDDLHRRFRLRLVLWMVWPRRQDRRAVMAREVEHGVVAAWLVAVRVRDQRARVVGHDQLRHAAEEAQGARRRFKPVGHRLARRGADVGVAGGAQRRHEHVGPGAVGEADGGAGVVDEQLFTGAVHLAHRALQLLGKAAVVLAELGVAVGLLTGVVGAVLLPQQHQRHTLAAQLLVQAAIVRLDVVTRPLRRHQQAPLQRGFIRVPGLRPVQPCGSGQAYVLGDDALRDAQRGGDLLVRQLGVQFQTQYVFDLTHSDPWCGHAISRKSWKRTRLGFKIRNTTTAVHDAGPVS